MGEIPNVIKVLLMPTFLFLEQARSIFEEFRINDGSEGLLNY